MLGPHFLLVPLTWHTRSVDQRYWRALTLLWTHSILLQPLWVPTRCGRVTHHKQMQWSYPTSKATKLLCILGSLKL